MYVLHMTHSVPDYDKWRAVFDSDPLGRKAAGVTRYRVGRRADDPNTIAVDLEFGDRAAADRMAGALRNMWVGAQQRGLIGPPSLDMIEVSDTVEL